MLVRWGKSWCFHKMQLYETEKKKKKRNCYIQLGILPFLCRQTWTSFPAPSLIRHRDESDMKHTILKDSYLRMYLGFGTDSSREPKTFNYHFSREMVWIFKKNQCEVLSKCCTKVLGCPQHIWVTKIHFLSHKLLSVLDVDRRLVCYLPHQRPSKLISLQVC